MSNPISPATDRRIARYPTLHDAQKSSVTAQKITRVLDHTGNVHVGDLPKRAA